MVTIYTNDHPPWHFHGRYPQQKAKFSLDDLSILGGQIPRRVRSLVIEWASEHMDDPRRTWQRAQAQEPIIKTPPLE